MIARWATEHRRLLGTSIGSALLIAIVLAVLVSGPSAAHASRRPPAATVLASARRQLTDEQARVTQLQAQVSTQQTEISTLTAQLQALRRRDRHRHHRRHHARHRHNRR